MLAQNSLSKQKLRGKLKVYAGTGAPARGQQPRPYSIKVSA